MITLKKVLSPANMREACRRVMANKGAAGVDGMTVDRLPAHLEKHGASICAHIREGKYIPAAVKRVDIPKPNGGTRMLGIPTSNPTGHRSGSNRVLRPDFLGIQLRISPWDEGASGH